MNGWESRLFWSEWRSATLVIPRSKSFFSPR